MPRSASRVAVVAAVACALLAQPATAQTGNGLYEPFPQAESRKQGERFIERLPRAPNQVGERVSGEDLERGRFVAGGNASSGGRAEVPPGVASARAGREEGGDSPAWPVQIALAFALLAAVALALATRRPSGRRRVALGVAVAGALVLAASVVVSAGGDDREPSGALDSSPVPKDFVGIVAPDVLAAGERERERVLGRQRAAAIGAVRQTFDWAEIEVAPGRYDFERYDRYVADLAREGMRVLPVLFNAPPFRTRRPSGPNGPFYPPTEPAAMGEFAAVLAARYGPKGSLWAQRPGLRRLPIRAWQVWNEPNLGFYWGRKPSAAGYTRMLGASKRAIERVDPAAEIVSAGITQGRLGVPAPEFLAGMYRAGGKRAFDTLAVQAYARDASALVGAVAGIRQILRENDDRRLIWLTEFGWATGGPLSDFTVGEAAQARLVADAVRELAGQRRELGLRGLAYFRWRDAPPYAGGKDFFGLHTGLVRIDGRPKPALAGFGRSARAVTGGR